MTEQPDPAAVILAGMQERNEQWITSMALTAASVADSPFGDVRRLVTALRVPLGLHRRSQLPASSGEDRGGHYCLACTKSIDFTTEYMLWPCFEYLSILAALDGTDPVTVATRLRRSHWENCPVCREPGTACVEQTTLTAVWRRTLREAERSP